MKIPIICLFLACIMQQTQATVEWNGPITSNVIDENIDITGNCFLAFPTIYIVAEGADVTVTVKNKSLIQAQENCQEIIFVAVWPYTITIKVEHDLEFRGVENLETEPCYIYVFGNNEIRWEVKKNKHLRFNKTDSSGATQLWIGVFDGEINQIFKSSEQKQISFGPECLIGYAVNVNIPWTTALEMQKNTDKSSYITFEKGSSFAVQIIND